MKIGKKENISSMLKKTKNKISIKNTATSTVKQAMKAIEERSGGKLSFSDERTKNELNRVKQGKEAKLYITAVTDDCPAQSISFCGIDFPRFVELTPENKLGGRISSLRRMVVKKRTWLTDKQVESILAKAVERFVPVTIEDKDKDGNVAYMRDEVRATHFLILQEIDPRSSDPIELQPISKRSRSLEKLIRKANATSNNRLGIVSREGKHMIRTKSIEGIKASSSELHAGK